jgi:hypothetical protein
MQQSLTIMGLKELMLVKVIDELTSIQKLFAHHVNKDNLELWQPGRHLITKILHQSNSPIDPSRTEVMTSLHL